MNERHPVQALVWGIVSLVVALGGLLILIAPAIFSIVYSAISAAGSSVPVGGNPSDPPGLFCLDDCLWRFRAHRRHRSPHHSGRDREALQRKLRRRPLPRWGDHPEDCLACRDRHHRPRLPRQRSRLFDLGGNPPLEHPIKKESPAEMPGIFRVKSNRRRCRG
jgi:hypothetical protein